MRQEKLEELLKKKGIGPQGSKSLKAEELNDVESLFKDDQVSLTTKATMLTALLTLEPNDFEKAFVEKIKAHPEEILPTDLLPYVKEQETHPLNKIINKAISLQELSSSECEQAMKYLLDVETPEFLKGSFLEAERLKRETFKENQCFFEALWNKSSRKEVDLPVLIDICDSYDGSNRSPIYTPFLASLLASAGFPVLIHGINTVAPKQGITSHKILSLAAKNPFISIDQAVSNIKDKNIGWAYLDQKVFFPELFALKHMRKEMVKRPFLATFEKLLQPVRNKQGNLIVTGYTHPHYREELVKQLKEQNKCAQALILKGIEGSTHISMARETVCVHYNGSEISDSSIHPDQFSMSVQERKIDKNLTEEDSLKEGLEALKGQENYAFHHLLYSGTLLLTKFNLTRTEEAQALLEDVLRSGKALNHWNDGQNS